MGRHKGYSVPPANENPRYRLTQEEEDLVFKFREQKTLLEKECLDSGIDVNSVKHYWYKSKLFSVFAKPNDRSIEDLKKEVIKNMDGHSPKCPKIKRNKVSDPHCLVIDPADIHIGKIASEYETADKYNSNIVEQEPKLDEDEIVKQLSPLLSRIKRDEGKLTNIIVGNNNKNAFWGSIKWLDKDGEPKPEHKYREQVVETAAGFDI